MKKYSRMLTCVPVAVLLAGSVMAATEDNKDAARNAMIDLFAKQDPSGVDRYFKSPYTQHNTRIPNELDTLRGLAQQATTWQGVHTIAVRAIAEGDLVLLQSTYSNLMGRKQDVIAMDFFRFDGGRIVEHWDSLEPMVPRNGAGVSQVNGSVDIVDLDRTQANRKLVLRFLETAVIGGKPQHAREFVDAKRFIEHNQHAGDGLGRNLGSFIPADRQKVSFVGIHKTVAEGNFVFVQGEGRINGDQILEIYDLYRVNNGRIVEHWDVLQPVAPPKEWANPNGPF